MDVKLCRLGHPKLETRSSCNSMARNFKDTAKERHLAGGRMAKYRGVADILIGILCKTGHISAALHISKGLRDASFN